MDSRAKIPALALLGLQFTGGCEDNDPIVGTWTATLLDDQVFPYEMEYEGYSFSNVIELRIGEDLHGQFWTRSEQAGPGIEAYYEYAQDLVVIPGDPGKYRIEISQVGLDFDNDGPPGYADGGYADGGYAEPEPDVEPEDLVLNCELADSKLRCTVELESPAEGPEEVRFQRKA